MLLACIQWDRNSIGAADSAPGRGGVQLADGHRTTRVKNANALRRNKDATWLGEWYSAGEWYVERDYELFAVLAGVRDDFPAPPISKPRGVPKDASSAYRGFKAQVSRERPRQVHTPSFVTLAEMLAYDLDQEFYDDSLVTERRRGAPRRHDLFL
jgi:hypothetical protein